MVRALVLATLAVVISPAAASQTLGVLHIKVVLLDADRKLTPVPHHALLVSANPASAPPRRLVTGVDGTIDLNLRPGNYTVESDRPVSFQGKAYQWAQTVDIVAGHDAVLELTAANAEIEAVGSASSTSAAALEADPSFLLPKWQDSVVAVWTPYTQASGFVVDAAGLVMTSQRAIGNAKTADVQLSSSVKVSASLLVSDPARDVAVLRIDPQAIASVQPVPLGCSQTARPQVVDRQEMFTIGVPLLQAKGLSSGTINRIEQDAIASDFILAAGTLGGPVFTADGSVIGLTSVIEGNSERRGDVRVVPAGNGCEVLAAAEKKLKDAAPPAGTHLPVEPERPFPVDALKDAAEHRASSVSPYQMQSSSFDVTFITPLMTYAESRSNQITGRDAGGSGPQQALVRPLMDFSNWSEYVDDFPPVLLVRVTPRLVEGFWTTVARGAARTQGVALPPIKHFTSGFARMRAFCGDAEVTPIHPFKLEQRVSETEAIYEGLYAFDPARSRRSAERSSSCCIRKRNRTRPIPA